MGRLMGLDIGTKRIGISVSDPLMLIAQGVETYERTADRKDIAYIEKLARSMGVDCFVAGIPISLDGHEGPWAKQVREFADKLSRRSKIRLVYEDEDFTTLDATKALLEGNVSRAKRRRVVDKVAAVLILQQYMDAHKPDKA